MANTALKNSPTDGCPPGETECQSPARLLSQKETFRSLFRQVPNLTADQNAVLCFFVAALPPLLFGLIRATAVIQLRHHARQG